jgi:polysaccharide deacetylase family protein (PEP-CTERM system associated)
MPDEIEPANAINAFTVDLEEWFCTHSNQGNIEEWGRYQPRGVESTRRFLALLARGNVEATFFVLGWVAERWPDLVAEVAAAGHEIATHGYAHTMLARMTPDDLERDLERALKVTERITLRKIVGYRAPFFSVTRATLWSLDVLRAMGLGYDSSIFPFAGHPNYGIADAPLDPYRHANGVIEIPLSCAVVAGRRVPCGGGGYFRLLPYALTRRMIDRCNRDGRGVIFYIHPWELDPDQPRIGVGRLERFRHYHNLESTERKLEQLLLDYTFTSIRQLLGRTRPAAE